MIVTSEIQRHHEHVRELTRFETAALSFLLPLSADYPNIDEWFRKKVVPGLRDGTRNLLMFERHSQIVGVGIAKFEPAERKICTVRIAPTYQGRGLGLRIFDSLLKWVDTDKPHLTVADRKLPEFERIFDWYGFQMTSAMPGRYLFNQVEFGFNEHQLGFMDAARLSRAIGASNSKPPEAMTIS